MPASWNHITDWLRQIDALRQAAYMPRPALASEIARLLHVSRRSAYYSA